MTAIEMYAPESVLAMDATAIAEKIKNGEMTSYEVVSAYIEHIKKSILPSTQWWKIDSSRH